MKSSNPDNHVIKSSDATTSLIGFSEGRDLLTTIERYKCLWNGTRTKHRRDVFPRLVVIHSRSISQVVSHKYIGVFIVKSLSCNNHRDRLFKQFTKTILLSTATYGLLHWWKMYISLLSGSFRGSYNVWHYSLISVISQSKPVRLMHTAGKIIGPSKDTFLQSVYEQASQSQNNMIESDHPVFHMLSYCPLLDESKSLSAEKILLFWLLHSVYTHSLPSFFLSIFYVYVMWIRCLENLVCNALNIFAVFLYEMSSFYGCSFGDDVRNTQIINFSKCTDSRVVLNFTGESSELFTIKSVSFCRVMAHLTVILLSM